MLNIYSKANEAIESVLGRSRNRHEVEHGTTCKIVDGVKTIESIRMLHAERDLYNATQMVSHDYETIVMFNEPNIDFYSNNFMTDSPIEFFISGDFFKEVETTKMVKIPGRRGRFATTVKSKVKACIGHGTYKVVDVIEGDKTVIKLKKV